MPTIKILFHYISIGFYIYAALERNFQFYLYLSKLFGKTLSWREYALLQICICECLLSGNRDFSAVCKLKKNVCATLNIYIYLRKYTSFSLGKRNQICSQTAQIRRLVFNFTMFPMHWDFYVKSRSHLPRWLILILKLCI